MRVQVSLVAVRSAIVAASAGCRFGNRRGLVRKHLGSPSGLEPGHERGLVGRLVTAAVRPLQCRALCNLCLGDPLSICPSCGPGDLLTARGRGRGLPPTPSSSCLLISWLKSNKGPDRRSRAAEEEGSSALWIRGDIGGNLNDPQLGGGKSVPVVLKSRSADPPFWFPLCSNVGPRFGSHLGRAQRIAGRPVLAQVFGLGVGSGPHETP
jgi:hypothetical protein